MPNDVRCIQSDGVTADGALGRAVSGHRTSIAYGAGVELELGKSHADSILHMEGLSSALLGPTTYTIIGAVVGNGAFPIFQRGSIPSMSMACLPEPSAYLSCSAGACSQLRTVSHLLPDLSGNGMTQFDLHARRKQHTDPKPLRVT